MARNLDVILERGAAKSVGAVQVGGEFEALEVASLPYGPVRLRVSFHQGLDDMATTVPAARRSDLPELGRRHRLEVLSRSAWLLPREDGFPLDQLR